MKAGYEKRSHRGRSVKVKGNGFGASTREDLSSSCKMTYGHKAKGVILFRARKVAVKMAVHVDLTERASFWPEENEKNKRLENGSQTRGL